MNAEQVLAFAEAVRAYALESRRGLNAANLLVHTVLTRTLRAEAAGEEEAFEVQEYEPA